MDTRQALVRPIVTESKEYLYGTLQYKSNGLENQLRKLHEGLVFLDILKASELTMRAYCLRPRTNADSDIITFNPEGLEGKCLVYAMEFRSFSRQGNAASPSKRILKSPLTQVNQMLTGALLQTIRDFNEGGRAKDKTPFATMHYHSLWLSALELTDQKVTNLMVSFKERVLA